jgi:hypothetical protein
MHGERQEKKRKEDFLAELLPFFPAGRSYPRGNLPSQEKDLKGSREKGYRYIILYRSAQKLPCASLWKYVFL